MNDFTVHVKPLIADVPGWLTDEEGEALYDLARTCTGEGVIVEIGSWMGKSTICLGRGSLAGASVPIYAIDPHTDHRFGDFKANVDRAGITDLVTPIASLSQPAADDFHEPIELLFVDGSHEYDLVLEDFEKWVPKVIDERLGRLSRHDLDLRPAQGRGAGDLPLEPLQGREVRRRLDDRCTQRSIRTHSPTVRATATSSASRQHSGSARP